MKIMSNISAVEVRFKKTLDELRKIEVVQSWCTGNDYAQVNVVADGIAQITTGETCNATALELCRAMKKTWWIAGHNDDNEDNDTNGNDSKWLEKLLGTVKQKWSSNYKSKCFNCNKIGHKSAYCPDKKMKGGSEKASAATQGQSVVTVA
jgi:hypothetical protein